MKPRRVVTVLLPAVSGLSRDLVRGIAEYAETQGDWHLVLELYGMVGPNSFRAIQQGTGVLTESLLPLSNPASPQWEIPVVGMQDLRMLKHGPVVSSDNPATGRMAGEYFAEKGMTHLAYVSYAKGNQTEKGLREAAAAAGLSCQSYYLGDEKPELDVRARKRLMHWFESLPVPSECCSVTITWRASSWISCRRNGCRNAWGCWGSATIRWSAASRVPA